MTDSEFIKRLDTALEGRTLKLVKNIFYVLSYGKDDVLWVVTDGVMITERNNSDGTQIGSGIYGPSMIIGITALNGESGIVTCKPLKDTKVVGYSTKELLKLMNDDREVMMHIVKFLCGRFRFMMNSLEMNSLRSVPERIKYFETLVKAFNDDELLGFGDNTVAEYLGIHPASISRARKQIYNKDTGKNR